MVKRQLLLIRHAKTEQWGYDDDHGRQLTGRGFDDCLTMAQRLAETGFVPERVLVSTATRTKQTAETLAKHLGWSDQWMTYSRGLYLASGMQILEQITLVPDEVTHLAVIGHNPGISESVMMLGIELDEDLPTCAMVIAGQEGSWKDILHNPVSLVWYSWPKSDRRKK